MQRWLYEFNGNFDLAQYWDDEVEVQNRITQYFDNKLNDGYGELKVYNIEHACSHNGFADVPRDEDEYIHKTPNLYTQQQGVEDEA